MGSYNYITYINQIYYMPLYYILITHFNSIHLRGLCLRFENYVWINQVLFLKKITEHFGHIYFIILSLNFDFKKFDIVFYLKCFLFNSQRLLANIRVWKILQFIINCKVYIPICMLEFALVLKQNKMYKNFSISIEKKIILI